MAFTRIDFNQIQGSTEFQSGINIEKNINFKEQVSIPLIPPSQDTDSVIWVDPSTGTFKNRINLVNYSASFKGEFKNIAFGSPDTLSLGGNTGIVNDLVVSGAGTILNIRSNAFGTVQWSVLEVKGNLTVASGCTVNLIRTPIIVRGSIIGDGTISSPNGVNGGTGGIGGPGGVGGKSGNYKLYNYIINGIGTGDATGEPGGTSPSTWTGKTGTSAISMPTEYGISSGKGGDGGRGTGGGGGGGGGGAWSGGPWSGGSVGIGSNPIYSGGTGQFAIPFYGSYAHQFGGGGGGAGGPGTSANYPSTIGYGGPGANGGTGETGGVAGTLNTPYTGVGTPSSGSAGSAGTFGGAGGQGNQYDVYTPPGFDIASTDGSQGGNGGNGGAGGGTGGTHISIYCAGTVSSNIKIRPGKGGLTGGSTSLARAQTGPVWLFTLNNDPIDTDVTGATGTPNGPAGVLTRVLTTNSSAVSDFFTNILFEPNGLTPAKNKIAITI